MPDENVTIRARATAPLNRRLTSVGVADACYFRSGPAEGGRKALLKITDRCDLRCAHCFVSATHAGSDMSPGAVATVVERLQAARVTNVTVTGGEPLVHDGLLEILDLLVAADFEVTVCTNGVALTDEIVEHVLALGHISFNVSVDGITADSHGRFRGRRESFESTIANARRLGEAGLLKGVLSTPNTLASPGEYDAVFGFTESIGADYLLMNPLSSFGRGIRTGRRLKADERTMNGIRQSIESAALGSATEAVFIRFPNVDLPLGGCIAGDIIYVFVNGEVAVCPYLVFATENPGSRHRREEFIVGNLPTPTSQRSLTPTSFTSATRSATTPAARDAPPTCRVARVAQQRSSHPAAPSVMWTPNPARRRRR